MARILNYANDVSLQRRRLVRRGVSNAGFARTQTGSPPFYDLSANLPLLTKDQYDEVNAEILDLQDGSVFLDTTLPNNFIATNLQQDSVFTTNTNLVTHPGVTAVNSSTGIITIDGLTSTGNVKKGDYIQFARLDGDSNNTTTKVYQITEDASVTNGLLNIKLNSALINNITGSSLSVTPTGQVTDITITFNTTNLGAASIQANISTTQVGSSIINDNPDILSTGLINLGQYNSLQNSENEISEIIQLINARAANNSNLWSAQAGDGDDIRITFSPLLKSVTGFNINTGQGDTLTSDVVSAYDPGSRGDIIRVGNDVEFRFMLTDTPSATIVPGPGFNYYQFDTFNFREVIDG